MASKKLHQEKAELLFHEKLTLDIGLIREMKIWKVPKSKRFPQGVRYSLALVNPENGVVLLLFDNHPPKGPHVHRENQETSYPFSTLERLILDFRRETEEIERRVRNDNETN